MNCKYYIAELFIWRRESLLKKKKRIPTNFSNNNEMGQ